jgi:hypothetical protein
VDGNESVLQSGFTVSATAAGIVRLCWRRGMKITGSAAAEAMAAVDAINGEHRRPLLVTMAGIAGPTRDARRLWGRRCTASRVALLGESAVDRVGASFVPVLGVRGFPVPTRFFTSESKAVAWLLGDEP